MVRYLRVGIMDGVRMYIYYIVGLKSIKVEVVEYLVECIWRIVGVMDCLIFVKVVCFYVEVNVYVVFYCLLLVVCLSIGW